MLSILHRISIYCILLAYTMVFASCQKGALVVGLRGGGRVTTDSSSACGDYLYSFDCLAAPKCLWCCEAEFGSQCMARDVRNDSLATCSPGAVLSESAMTCRDLCYTSGSECASCEHKKWCYFCLSSHTCQGPEEYCHNNAIVQRCSSTNSDEDWVKSDRIYALAVLFVGSFLVVISLLGIAGILLYQRVVERRRARQIAAEQQQYQRRQNPSMHPLPLQSRYRDSASAHEQEFLLADSAEPALGPTFENAGDATNLITPSHTTSISSDDPVCYLCFAARPSVTFLPCYHTCCCESCSNRLRPVVNKIVCPFCRDEIKSMVSLANVLQWSSEQRSS